MPDYFGLHAIAKRLAVSTNTVVAWHLAGKLLIYRRGRLGRKACWYTNDALILASELARCRTDLAKRLAQSKDKRAVLPRRRMLANSVPPLTQRGVCGA